MSTNKSEEESLGLVPAARSWWSNMAHSQNEKFHSKYFPHMSVTNDSQVEHIWMQEVVLQWWEMLSWDRQAEIGSSLMMPVQSYSKEQIAELYLKEHPVKEESGTKHDMGIYGGKGLEGQVSVKHPLESISEDVAMDFSEYTPIIESHKKAGKDFRELQEKDIPVEEPIENKWRTKFANMKENRAIEYDNSPDAEVFLFYEMIQNTAEFIGDIRSLKEQDRAQIEYLTFRLQKSTEALELIASEHPTANMPLMIQDNKSAISKAETFLTGTKITHP